MKRYIFPLLVICILLQFGCAKQTEGGYVKEDTGAKKELQGIWINEDDEDVAFRIKGDTVYFPDTISVPVYFRIEKDSFVLYGANIIKYPVVKRTQHLFEFINQSG